jgi:shikimate kinase
MKNIVLTGFMGTGKTAVGRELSRLLSMQLVDIDAEIEADQKMTINEIFQRFGEKYFRDLETATIRRVAARKNLIISTGGGAILREENMETLRENGIVFCLDAHPETILARTNRSEDRPLLRTKDPMAKIKELLNFRMPFYKKAGTLIDTEGKTPLQIAEEIAETAKCRR